MSRYLLAIAILALVAACKIGGGETNTGAAESCGAVSAACSEDADCCSYGCVSNTCVQNPNEGGTCRTTADCVPGRICRSGACTTDTLASCRDTADVCGVGSGLPANAWGDCCSGNCEGGRCTVNQAPTASVGASVVGGDLANAPYTKLVQITDATTEADGDPLTRSWYLTRPVGSAAELSVSSPPSFTPDRPGDYVVRLVVTEGPTGAPDRYVLEDSVTVHVVNTVPVVTASLPEPDATWPRNLPITITGTASDLDGDALECAWGVTAPGQTTPAVQPDACNPASPSFTFNPTANGEYHVDLVVRDHDRTSPFPVVHETVARVTFTARNYPPDVFVPAVRAGNIGSASTPAVAIPIAATATDRNGDTGFTWTWTFDQVAPGSLLTDADIDGATVVGADASTARFAPDQIGFEDATRYVLRVKVCDAWDCDETKTVPVNVHRHVEPIDGFVNDAEWAAGKIFAVGSAPATDVTNLGRLWVFSGGALEKTVPLPTAPTQVGVDLTGRLAVVGDDVNVRWLDPGVASPTVQSTSGPFPIGDVAVTSTQYAVVFPKDPAASYLHILDPTASSFTEAFGRRGRSGAASATIAGRLYVNDPAADLVEYTVGKSGPTPTLTVRQTNATYACSRRLWAAPLGGHLFDGCGDAYTTVDLARSKALAGAALTRHVHADAVGASGAPIALDADGTALLRYDASFDPLAAPATSEALPVWGFDGVPHEAQGRFAFSSGDGATRWVIVEANGRTGLVTLP